MVSGLSQAEVAEIFGLSRARIQQIEARALRKIKAACLCDPELHEVVRFMARDANQQKNEGTYR